MKIFLVRHGAAVADSYERLDAHRHLTTDGRDIVRQVGSALKNNGVVIDGVVASPLVRAQQTAELLARELEYDGEVLAHVALSVDAQPQPFLTDLPLFGQSVLVVGHEPNISQLAGLIVGQPGGAPFRYAQVRAFEGAEPLWSLHPQTLQIQDHYVP